MLTGIPTRNGGDKGNLGISKSKITGGFRSCFKSAVIGACYVGECVGEGMERRWHFDRSHDWMPFIAEPTKT